MSESDWSKVKDQEPSRPFELPVKSPCVSICALNNNDVCEGCFRSAQEITRWGSMTNDERRQVLKKSHERAIEMQRVWWVK